jgi:hypothetical protein
MSGKVPTPVGVKAPAPARSYNYGNSRPFSVFALAAGAALGILGLTWGAHTALTAAAAEQHIGPSPDLKRMIERVGRTAQKLIGMAA